MVSGQLFCSWAREEAGCHDGEHRQPKAATSLQLGTLGETPPNPSKSVPNDRKQPSGPLPLYAATNLLTVLSKGMSLFHRALG